jgi:copper(I)-binding protein
MPTNSAGDLHIAHPWSLLPPNAPNVAAYFVVHNNGKADDRLLRWTAPSPMTPNCTNM